MKDIRQLERTLRILGNRRRLAMLSLLKKNSRLIVSEIASALRISFNATSRHLIQLHDIGVLDKEQVSLEVYYKIATSQTKIVRDIIEEL